MITIWKTPIVATVEQVLKDLKLQLYGAGLLKEIKNTGSDLMCTCPFHANGKEHNPSCGVLLQQKVTKDKTYEAGTVHCYTCGYTADLPQFVAHACSQILWFTKGSLLDEKYKEVSSGYANPSGNLVSVKVEKNKVTKNDRRLQTYTLNYSTGVDEIKDTLDLAIMLGIISQAGAWFKAILKDGKEQKMQGFNGVQEFYYNDLEELEHLRKQVYEAGMA